MLPSKATAESLAANDGLGRGRQEAHSCSWTSRGARAPGQSATMLLAESEGRDGQEIDLSGEAEAD
uniref:Uncharacterized protein n=1 Tax=Arundo donax TaxID=35708 RepID=A0A0A9DNJ5_ARUDO